MTYIGMISNIYALIQYKLMTLFIIGGIMSFADIIGLAAGALTTIAFVPQITRTIKLKSTRDISLGMYIVLATGIFLWIIYGICLGSLPIILANIVTLVFSLALIAFKLKYK